MTHSTSKKISGNSALMHAVEEPKLNQYDHTVPQALRLTQEWMAQHITTPLGSQYKLARNHQGEALVKDEACEWIRPSPTLKPHECLELYSQQYWWRMLNTLEMQYPLTRRILGGSIWNTQLAVPYLHANTPRHWSLYTIDDRLLDFLRKTPCGAHPEFTYDTARLDYAYLHVMHLAQHTPLKNLEGQHQLEKLFEATLYTQPHLFLLEFPCDLPYFRREVLKTSKEEKDYYLKTPLPTLEFKNTSCYFVLYRETASITNYVELSSHEARYLRLFIAGTSIEKSLDWVETQDKQMQKCIEKQLAEWLQKWIALGWLTLEKPLDPLSTHQESSTCA